ncbi:hypothetical protein SDC9_140750 [bioreactor metagenome]|uniref:Uncharacterized protein n=1 Tax=bioreactor metagenome TaxID=1076179 RepID=A0A645DVS3_9ZZZZ
MAGHDAVTQRAHIGPRAKTALPGTGQPHLLHPVVIGPGMQDVRHLVDHGTIHRVDALWTIQCQRGDTVADFTEDLVGH